VPRLPFTDEVRALLEAPNPAVITTLRRDGQPVSVATWYAMVGDRVLVNMDEGRVRLKHLRHDPRVGMTVLDDGNWGRHVSLVGRVVELYEDTDLADIDLLSRRYGGGAFRNRERGRVSALIEVERWHAWAGAGPL
jgi:PPOX class probable F420-dependent enzyme